MTKKVRHWRGKSRTSASVIKSVNKDNFASAICPTNVEEQKHKFLEYGKTPEFTHRGSEDQLEEMYSKPRSEIRFDLLGEAMHILRMVKEKYGDAENYYQEMYGDRITKAEATDIIVDYLKENRLDGAMSIIWCSDLPCSGRMMWQGPHVKYRRPEARKFSMWIKDSKDNNFLREHGIRCLADHEIGTHFFRSHNDGLQPWFADRTRFGIRGLSGLDQLRTEEGLAAINTILNARVRYLWGPALLYYIACKATELTFKQLFEHLAIYVSNPEWRWRHCVRVKRGLLNPNDIGGYGKDQCYFEGAVELLRNADNIDFKLLMCGKICYDELQRVKKLVRMDCIQMPAFMRNQEKYKKTLKQIAHMNGLHLQHSKFKAPIAYLRRLKKGRRIGNPKTNKVRKKGKKGENGGVRKGSVSERVRMDENSDDSDDDSGDEERFFFEQYSLAAKDNFGSTGDTIFEAVDGSKLMGQEIREVGKGSHRRDRHRYQGDHMDSSTEETVRRELERVLNSKSNKLDDSLEDNKEHYRCLSRGSIHSLLNQPSRSLNSRTRTAQKDGSAVLLSRPNSSCSSISQTCTTTTPKTDISSPSDTSLNKSMIYPTSPLFLMNAVTQHRLIPTNDDVTDSERGSERGLTPSCSSGGSVGSSVTNIRMVMEASSTTSATPLINCRSVQQNVIRSGQEGVIFPDKDLPADDTVQVNTGNQTGADGDKQETSSPVIRKPKLLTRRIKSAANMLPKVAD